MTTLASHAPAVTRVDGGPVRSSARRAVPWRAIAAETVFVLGLCTLCVALVALRLTVLPQDFIPRAFVSTTFGAAAIATIGAFLAVGAIRGQSRRR